MQPLCVPPTAYTPWHEATYPNLITIQPPPFQLTAECVDYTVITLSTLWPQPDERGQTREGEWQKRS